MKRHWICLRPHWGKRRRRLSSVGLSGGFGTVTLGQIWSASYNHVGVLTDNGVWSGNNNSPTLRTSSNLSYSASTGPISFQLDAGMDDGKDDVGTGRSLDMAQLGLSFDTGAATIRHGVYHGRVTLTERQEPQRSAFRCLWAV